MHLAGQKEKVHYIVIRSELVRYIFVPVWHENENEWCWDTTVGGKQEKQDLVADTIVLDRDEEELPYKTGEAGSRDAQDAGQVASSEGKLGPEPSRRTPRAQWTRVGRYGSCGLQAFFLLLGLIALMANCRPAKLLVPGSDDTFCKAYECLVQGFVEALAETGDTEEGLFEAFQGHDRDGSGFISTTELRHHLVNSGEFTDEEAEVMIRDADLDGDKQVMVAEMEQGDCVDSTEDAEMTQAISEAMDELDTNKDGAVQLFEWNIGMESEEQKQDFEDLFHEMDVNGNGQIDEPEMPAFVQEVQERWA